MKDPRHTALARMLVEYSVSLQPGEACLIQSMDVPPEMTEALIEAVSAAGGRPVVNTSQERLQRALLKNADDDLFSLWADIDEHRMKRMDAFIGIRGYENPKETSGIADDLMSRYMRTYYQRVHHNIRVPKTKWVVLRYPTPAMAYMAGMPTDDFETFYYQACSEVDYPRMSKAMDRAAEFLNRADRVEITGPGTDLRFSIAGLGSVKCDGKRNIPDGEIYTAPVRDSVEGVISYNTPSTYQGVSYRDIRFEFSKGKIIRAEAAEADRINAVLDTDEGSRYIGEFALGCNPRITRPMDEILFDEKIAGSFHFTPGAAYQECSNGNISAVHWDLVAIQTPEYGGGEITIDGELIRKDGRFVHEAFAGLNPEELAGS